MDQAERLRLNAERLFPTFDLPFVLAPSQILRKKRACIFRV